VGLLLGGVPADNTTLTNGHHDDTPVGAVEMDSGTERIDF